MIVKKGHHAVSMVDKLVLAVVALKGHGMVRAFADFIPFVDQVVDNFLV